MVSLFNPLVVVVECSFVSLQLLITYVMCILNHHVLFLCVNKIPTLPDLALIAILPTFPTIKIPLLSPSSSSSGIGRSMVASVVTKVFDQRQAFPGQRCVSFTTSFLSPLKSNKILSINKPCHICFKQYTGLKV